MRSLSPPTVLDVSSLGTARALSVDPTARGMTQAASRDGVTADSRGIVVSGCWGYPYTYPFYYSGDCPRDLVTTIVRDVNAPATRGLSDITGRGMSNPTARSVSNVTARDVV